MKLIHYLLSLLLLVAGIPALGQNPYESLGKKEKALTLTKGQYAEFFDSDSIQQVGTVLMNVRTLKVVKLLSEQEAQERLQNEKQSRFLSVDPLTSSYPELTPYQYASNSPIQNIDLDGLEGTYYSGVWIAHDNLPRVAHVGVIDAQSRRAATPVLPAKAKAEQITATQSPVKAKPRAVIQQLDTSPGAEMRRQALRQQAEFAKQVNQAMQTPEGQGGMALAGAMYGTARTPVDATEYSYGIYEGIQDKNGFQVAGNTLGLGITVAPFIKLPRFGSGPISGVLEVSPNVKSVDAFRNYTPSQGMVEFVFETTTNRFLVGRPNINLAGSPHQQLVKAGSLESRNVVGGMFKRGSRGEILTNEYSGHYHQNWTPEIREQFSKFMESKTEQNISHSPGM